MDSFIVNQRNANDVLVLMQYSWSTSVDIQHDTLPML